MAKIILSGGDGTLTEVPLLKERTTIGRRADNDVVIVDPAISAEHAVIVRRANESVIQDLNSTNGIQINGETKKSHRLTDNDVIELGQHKLRYLAEPGHRSANSDVPERDENADDSANRAGGLPLAFQGRIAEIIFLNGPNAGKAVLLGKPLTTIGRGDGTAIIIAAGTAGYNILPVAGAADLRVNGNPLGTDGHPLVHDDLIELFETRMKFSWP